MDTILEGVSTRFQVRELKEACQAYRTAAVQSDFGLLNLGSAAEDTTALDSPTSQMSPSELSKELNTPLSVGYMVFDEYDLLPAKTVFASLVPDLQAMKKDEVHRIGLILQDSSFSRGLVPLKEEHSVQTRYEGFASGIGFSRQANSVKYSILGSPSAATSNGNLDGAFSMVSPFDTSENWALAVWENQGQESSTFLAVRQACTAYGFGIATFLAGIGMPQQDIVVAGRFIHWPADTVWCSFRSRTYVPSLHAFVTSV